tara:strand:+ start:527 stop:1201 length:675 start_codon:yes stop_codon:yes gene_type:complete
MAEYDSEKDHNMDPTSHVVKDKETGMFCVYNVNNKKVAEFETKDEADAYAKKNHDDLMKKEAMSPKEKAAHAKAIAAFKARGGKIKKLPPGKAAGYHGKDDPGKDVKGMLSRPDSGKFKKGKKVRPMSADTQSENTVKSFFDIRREATLEVNGITESKEPVNEATNMFTDDRTGFQIDRFAMGSGKVGFQINYGKGRGKFIQVPMDDMKRVVAQMTKAMKAKIR